MQSLTSFAIDLFSLYVLFFLFRPRDATRGNSFFQMSSYARANVRIANAENKRKTLMRASCGLEWENKMYKLKIKGILYSLPFTGQVPQWEFLVLIFPSRDKGMIK